MLIRNILEESVQKFGEVKAVKWLNRKEVLERSYSEMMKNVISTRKGLLAEDFAGKHIALIGTSSVEWIESYLGIITGCTTAVPLDAALPCEELIDLINRSDSEALFLSPKHRPYLEAFLANCPKLQKVWMLQEEVEDVPSGVYSINELRNTGISASADASCPAAEDIATIIFTSGTTGKSKGVMLTHYNISNNGFLTGEHMKFTGNDKLCCCVPLFHCFGVVLATMNCLTHGCTQVMVERFDPLIVLASIHKEKCTALYGVPTMFIAELNHPMFDMFDMSSLRTGIMAGSLCPVELMKQVEEKMYMKVTSVYGLTEAAPGMTATRIDDPFDVRCNTVGRDFEFTEVKVLDPETGEECPVGVQGEMCNRGYNTMKGYYKNPQATAEVIDKNNFLHSGDLGIKDEDGNYRITGRIKDMIIRGGENIYPREIEEFLYKLDGVIVSYTHLTLPTTSRV